MDQKKTLWIIAAVGVFLLAVLGAALIMYAPSRQCATPVTCMVKPEKKQVNGWASSPELQPPSPMPVPGYNQNPEKTSEMIVLSDNTKVYSMPSENAYDSTTIDLNALKQEIAVNGDVRAPAVAAQPQNINITVNIPESTSSKETTKETEKVYNSEVYSSEYYVEKTIVAPQPDFRKPEPKKAEAPAAKPAPAPAKAAPKATAKPAPEPKKVTTYWVQVAAYSNKKGAENARSVLDSNKIPADIFTFQDNKNNLFYRVRVGPYTTKSEAEYWRTRIIQINEFSKAESYVTSATN